jgi:hypothetical protein
MARIRLAPRRVQADAVTWFQRQSFHTFLTAPATTRLLDDLIQDNRAHDAAIEAERAEQDDRDELGGSTCGAACGYCGRCS